MSSLPTNGGTTASSASGAAPTESQCRISFADSIAAACRNLARRAYRTADAAALVLLAPECAACGSLLQGFAAGPICEACWSAVAIFAAPICDRCGDPLERAPVPNERLCRRCAVHPGVVKRARAIGNYDGILREVIHALKYDKRRSIARRLGALMRAHGTEVLCGADLAVPVPLHWTRRHQRGFNQASLLAAQLGLPVVDALRRIRRTRSQVDLPAPRRSENVAGAFARSRRFRPDRLEGAIVVLVDDVSTTGSTIEACARVLMDAGVLEVRALTAARVSTRSL